MWGTVREENTALQPCVSHESRLGEGGGGGADRREEEERAGGCEK